MTRPLLVLAALSIAAAAGCAQTADQVAGSQPVTKGKVVRGVNAPPPPGGAGTPNGRTCDFSREEVDQNGRMTGASVQCGSDDVATLLANLPGTFNSYCVAEASRLGGRLISAPVSGNARHCDLSALTPAQATDRFGGGKWR